METISLLSFLAELLHRFPVLSLLVFLAIVMTTYYKWAIEPTLGHVRARAFKRDAHL